ncbi:MAG TPA: AAA family ATPase, partial [Acidimicrobiales bacterium]
ELARLSKLAGEAAAGALRMVAIEGDAGIGKTRLLAEWLTGADPATVLWGRCSGARLPFEPVVQSLVARLATDPGAVDRLGPYAGTLAAVLPEIFGDADAPSTEPEYARASIFRALAAAVADASAGGVAALVIDDLQAADADTIDLVRFLVESLGGERLVVALTVKEAEGDVVSLLSELQRRGLERVALRGLSDDEVAGLLSASGVDADHAHAIAATLRARTAGNPLYVHQIVGEARSAGEAVDPEAVPIAIRELLARRVAALSDRALETLQMAAAAGERIEVDAIAACSVHAPSEVVATLEELARRGFLADVAPGTFDWVHGLVRDAVVDATPPTRAAALHLRLALALEDTAPAAVAAHHYRRAGRPGVAGAILHGLRAGWHALEQSAWTAAARELSAVLDVASDPDERAAALIGLGHADRGRRLTGDARRHFEDALAVARDADLARRAAEAVLGLLGGGGRGVGVDLADHERANRLRRALAGLADGDDDLAVPLLAELAVSLVLTPDSERERDALTARAIERARQHRDAALVATALVGRRAALLDATSAVARLADADEILAMPRASLRPERRLAALVSRVEDLLVLGRSGEAERAAAAALDDAAAFDHPYWLWAATTWSALVSIVHGRLDDAERLAFEALGHQPENPEAVAALGVQLVDLRLFQGRAGEVVDLLAAAADDNPHIPAYRAVLALCAAEAGDRERAADAYEHFAREGFANLPRDSNRFLALAVLADTCATLGDRDSAPVLAGALRPYEDLHVVLNCFGGGGAYWGPTALHLARLALLTGDVEAASAYSRRAAEAARSIGSPLVADRVATLVDAL